MEMLLKATWQEKRTEKKSNSENFNLIDFYIQHKTPIHNPQSNTKYQNKIPHF